MKRYIIIEDNVEILSYLAGMIDGDGSLSVASSCKSNKKYYYIIVSIFNTNIDLMNWLKKNVGGTFYTGKQRYKNSKPLFEWMVTGANAYALLLLLKPYLKIRLQQCDLLIEMYEKSQMNNKMVLGRDTIAYRDQIKSQINYLNNI